MAMKSAELKDKTLSVRVSDATHRFLRQLAGNRGTVSDLAREKIEMGLKLPSLSGTARKLASEPRETFTSIMLQHLEGKGTLGRAEYLFLVYRIQEAASTGSPISRERFLELVRLHRELYDQFRPRFPDEHYLRVNLNAYARSTGSDREVPALLEQVQVMAQSMPPGATLGPDLLARNLMALIEESEQIDEGDFSRLLAKYQDTLVTLAAPSVFGPGNEPGPAERFRHYLVDPVTVTEKGDWYHLQVVSSASGFSAVVSLGRFVIPLGYRHFSAFSSPDAMVPIPALKAGEPVSFMVHLPHSIRLFLSREEAASLSGACTRIRTSPAYRSHDRILSLLHGTADYEVLAGSGGSKGEPAPGQPGRA